MAHGLHNFIMKYSKTALYKWVYNHPQISIFILVVFALIILYIFVTFVMQNILVPVING